MVADRTQARAEVTTLRDKIKGRFKEDELDKLSLVVFLSDNLGAKIKEYGSGKTNDISSHKIQIFTAEASAEMLSRYDITPAKAREGVGKVGITYRPQNLVDSIATLNLDALQIEGHKFKTALSIGEKEILEGKSHRWCLEPAERKFFREINQGFALISPLLDSVKLAADRLKNEEEATPTVITATAPIRDAVAKREGNTKHPLVAQHTESTGKRI